MQYVVGEWGGGGAEFSTVNVSFNSKPDHPLGTYPGEFSMDEFLTPGHKESMKPLPLGQTGNQKLHSRGKYFHKFREKQKN